MLCRLAVAVTRGEESPENARVLIRQGHGGHLGATPRPQLLKPDTPGILFPVDPPDNRHGAVQQQATQSGMQRVAPSTYVAGVEIALDLGAPIGVAPVDQTPLWLRAVALVFNTVGGPRDVMASTKR